MDRLPGARDGIVMSPSATYLALPVAPILVTCLPRLESAICCLRSN
jgi:hypothetical protein